MKKRENIDEKYKWDLSGYFDNKQWDKELSQLTKEVDKFSKYNGKLIDKPTILQCLKDEDDFGKKLEKLYVYAALRRDENLANNDAQVMCNKVMSLNSRVGMATSFIVAQLNKLDEKILDDIINDNSFSDYKRYFEQLKKSKAHILTEEQEKILSGMSIFSGEFKANNSSFANADLVFDNIVDSNGKIYPLDESNAAIYTSSPDRVLRQNAFKTLNGTYGKYNNFLSNNYLASVKKDCFVAQCRHFDSALDKALFDNEIDTKVYKTLVKNVNANIPIVYKYFSKKAKILNIKKFANYDVYAPIGNNNSKFTYNKAISVIKKALAPMGDEYLALIDKAVNDRWIDVYPNVNKRSGAYSWGAYGCNPVVLTNFIGDYNSVTTLIHELGHAMHTYYSNKNNHYRNADYSIFCAEVASTVNEIFLARYLIDNEKDLQTKRYYINQLIKNFQATIYRQTMFAEFEDWVHKMIESNKDISSVILNQQYMTLVEKYFGNSTVIKEMQYEWSRIPHFYTAYYVYQYATGLISATAIVDNILSHKPNAVENYKTFLKGGSSMPPVELLKIAGADLTKQSTYDKAFDFLNKLIEEL